MAKLIIILMLSNLFSQTISPCDEKMYLNLKTKTLDEMSDREYQYFLNKDAQCNEYISSKNSNHSGRFNGAEISSLKNRKMLDVIGITTFYGLTVLGDALIDEGIDVPYLLIPVIGPFLAFIPSDEYNIEESDLF